MASRYDPNWVTEFYNAYGMKEWERLKLNPTEEAKLAVHEHYLKQHIRSGDRVLEIGAGPGRFTQILVELGARVCVADISATQLALNGKMAEDLGFAHGVEWWQCLDMCDLSSLPDGGFDAVVCYGGPLSYVFDRRDCAIAELKRMVKPGGVILMSVMSLWGTMHAYLSDVASFAPSINRTIVQTGDLHPETVPTPEHRCHMFRGAELHDLLADAGLEVLTLSASNSLTPVWGDRLKELRADPVAWAEILRLEIECSAQPGCVDMGTHTIAVARKTN